MKQAERYALDSSPFHRMGRAADLAALLQLSPKRLRRLISYRKELYYFKDECINGKQRALAVPVGEMRRVHERLKVLLSRIKLPNYLYSPRRGRAPVDNAIAHVGRRSVVKLDIKQFYPSTTDEHVFQFFRHRLGMADDVAGRLTKLATVDGRVPFGSPLSPILCALVHNDIFSQAAEQCELRGDTMSLWVDDLTVSGDNVGEGLVQAICQLVRSKRLQPHKAQRARGSKGLVITGTFIGPKGPAPSNKLHLKMRDKLLEFEVTSSVEERLAIARSLTGLIHYFRTVFPRGSEEYARLTGRLTWIHNERRKLEGASEQHSSLPT